MSGLECASYALERGERRYRGGETIKGCCECADVDGRRSGKRGAAEPEPGPGPGPGPEVDEGFES